MRAWSKSDFDQLSQEADLLEGVQRLDVSHLHVEQGRIGEGNWSVVRKGSFEGRAVAIKQATKDGADLELKREIGILRHLVHERIVQLEGICDKNGCFLVVLEFCAKGSLDKVVERERARLTPAQQLRMAIHISEGVCYLHEVRVFHGDLKLSNILVAADYGCKLCDFNLSMKISSETESFQARGGTRVFSAPEILNHKLATFAADVYGLGLCLFELLTLRDYASLLRLAGEGGVLRLLTSGMQSVDFGNWPPPFDRIQDTVELCLEYRPERRPSAEEVQVCLKSLDIDASATVLSQAAPPRRNSPMRAQQLQPVPAAALAVKHLPQRAGPRPPVFCTLHKPGHPAHGRTARALRYCHVSNSFLVQLSPAQRPFWVSGKSLLCQGPQPQPMMSPMGRTWTFKTCAPMCTQGVPSLFPPSSAPDNTMLGIPNLEEVPDSESLVEDLPTIPESASEEDDSEVEMNLDNVQDAASSDEEWHQPIFGLQWL